MRPRGPPARQHPPLGDLAVGALPGGDAVCGSLDLGDQPEHVALHLRLRTGAQDAPAVYEWAGDRPGRFALRDWVLFGFLWGAIALANPALVLFLPFAGIWVLTGQRRALRSNLASACVSGILFLVVLSPWMVRNARVFHHFVPLRANFGAELYLGNGPGATGLLMEYNHPQKDPQQLRLYAQMGEYRYAQMRGELAKQTIRADPGLFVRNTLKRLYFFWFSVPSASVNVAEPVLARGLNFGFLSTAGLLGLLLALRRRVYGAWLFFFAFLTLAARCTTL